ncbi:argonaute 4A-like protein [Tanacetum coccineum]
MDVCHGVAGSLGSSIAAVVSSRKRSLVSCFRASVRTQSSKVKMIDGLFKPVAPNKDEGTSSRSLYENSGPQSSTGGCRRGGGEKMRVLILELILTLPVNSGP